MNSFAKIKFPSKPELIEFTPLCLKGVCDGSGLVERECQYGYHFVKCVCKTN